MADLVVLQQIWPALDAWLALIAGTLLAPLATLLLISGMDDLAVDAAALLRRLWRARTGSLRCTASCYPTPDVERPIAVLVPLWDEAAVIADMVRHNTSAIQYENYRLFLGLYPNDGATLEAARALEAVCRKVHLCVGPRPGPTSKADCLNTLFRHVRRYEQESGCRFACFVVHDAEDVIAPGELAAFNALCGRYDMVQTAVLPLPTPLADLTHGVYCDEFAERHSKDLPLRQALGGFVPSCGVGTAYSRRAITLLRRANGARLFHPECLTEDYETGLSLHRLSARQIFLPPEQAAAGQLATREYFPRTFRAAVRQRTRWITGISLQSWERNGWLQGWSQRYWLWRDRKGLLTAPLGGLSLAVFLYGLLSFALSRLVDVPWRFGAYAGEPLLLWLGSVNLALTAVRSAIRALYVSRYYGWAFALLTPVRYLWGTWIDACASVNAIARYAHARWSARRLCWLKTAHCYPTRDILAAISAGFPSGQPASAVPRVCLLEESSGRNAA